MGKNGYHHWVNLNDDGKNELGYIFLDGVVPVKCMLGSKARLGDKDGVFDIFMIDWGELSDEQKDQCIDYLRQKHHAPKDVIRSDIENIGFIPLQAKYVCGSGTDQVQLFP